MDIDLGPITSWSFSRIQDYEKCDYCAYLKYALKIEEPPSEKRDEAAKRGTRVHKEAEDYVKGEGPMTKDLKPIEAELTETKEAFARGQALVEDPWGYDIDWQPVDWWADNVWLRVKLDSMLWLDDEHTAAVVDDVKTGKKHGNEVKHRQQGQLYAVSAFMRYPSLQVARVRFLYTDQGKPWRANYTREQAMAFFPSWDERGKKMTLATHFPPRPSRITCKYCPYGPTNGNGRCEYGVEA